MSRYSTQPPITLADAIQAPEGGNCLICQKPLGAEQHFVTALPDGEHVVCRKRRLYATEFPYEEQLASLRKLAVLMQRQYVLVVEVGKWLATIKRAWPGSRDAFDMDRAQKLGKLKPGLLTLYDELGRRGRRHWF